MFQSLRWSQARMVGQAKSCLEFRDHSHQQLFPQHIVDKGIQAAVKQLKLWVSTGICVSVTCRGVHLGEKHGAWRQPHFLGPFAPIPACIPRVSPARLSHVYTPRLPCNVFYFLRRCHKVANSTWGILHMQPRPCACACSCSARRGQPPSIGPSSSPSAPRGTGLLPSYTLVGVLSP